jgi:hypothetical protein
VVSDIFIGLLPLHRHRVKMLLYFYHNHLKNWLCFVFIIHDLAGIVMDFIENINGGGGKCQKQAEESPFPAREISWNRPKK